MTPPGRTQPEADPVDPDLEDADDLDEGSEVESEVEPEVDADDLDEGDDLEGDEVATGDPTLEADVADDEEAPTSAVVPPEAEFDDGGEDLVTAVTGEDDDDQDPIEGIRDGEFVCRSCFMAKRDTQLADAERLLCRDCA